MCSYRPPVAPGPSRMGMPHFQTTPETLYFLPCSSSKRMKAILHYEINRPKYILLPAWAVDGFQNRFSTLLSSSTFVSRLQIRHRLSIRIGSMLYPTLNTEAHGWICSGLPVDVLHDISGPSRTKADTRRNLCTFAEVMTPRSACSESFL